MRILKNKFFYFSILLSAVIFALTGCQKEYSLENGSTDTPATGSLTDSLGVCLGSTVHGTYYNGITPGGDTAYVDLQVNVTSPGTYNIKSNLQNGFLFADSGYFNATGVTTVRLRPLGTPILQVITDFQVTFDSTTCGFAIDVQDSTGHSTGGGTGGDTTLAKSDSAWTFIGNSQKFQGPLDLASVKDTLSLHVLTINGTTTTGDTSFTIGVFLPTTDIALGSYPTSTSGFLYFVDNANPTVPIYAADPSTTGFVVTINVTAYDPVLKVVSGNFSGTAVDALGNPVTIASGQFTSLVL